MKNTKIKIFIAITVIVLAGAAAFWFFVPRGIETEGQRDIGVSISDQSADMSETYTNSKYGFSFSHPKELNISEFTEGKIDVILVKDETGDGFQIYITPFDEQGPITKERILKDIPDMQISNDKEIFIDGESALSFKSKDTSLETFEIWFVYNGYLYQISSFASFRNKLEEIIKTWRFSD